MNMKRTIITTSVLFCLTMPTWAEDNKFGATADLTYMSQLMDKGGEYYGKQGGFLQNLDLNLWGTGLGFAVGHRNATSGGYVAKQRIDYKLYYGHNLFTDKVYETQVAVAGIYHQHPYGGAQFKDFYEWELALALTQLIPGGWIPGYKTCGEHNIGTSFASAEWWHLFNINKHWELEQLPNPLKLYADIAYRDGLGGIRAWTHATIGVGIDLEVVSKLFIVPALYHQFSLSNLLTPDDVTYAVVNLQYRH